jgi:mycoredoxin-dependent peroxiredoxin
MILGPGTVAPDFALPNQFGQTVRLGDFRGVRPVTLVFFPLAFSRTCEGELCELRDNIEIFADSGSELIAVSVDSKYALRAWAEEQHYGFTLLADFWPHGAVARTYGAFLEERGYADRATFVVDGDGIIRASFATAPGEARTLEQYRAALAS